MTDIYLHIVARMADYIAMRSAGEAMWNMQHDRTLAQQHRRQQEEATRPSIAAPRVHAKAKHHRHGHQTDHDDRQKRDGRGDSTGAFPYNL